MVGSTELESVTSCVSSRLYLFKYTVFIAFRASCLPFAYHQKPGFGESGGQFHPGSPACRLLRFATHFAAGDCALQIHPFAAFLLIVTTFAAGFRSASPIPSLAVSIAGRTRSSSAWV